MKDFCKALFVIGLMACFIGLFLIVAAFLELSPGLTEEEVIDLKLSLLFAWSIMGGAGAILTIAAMGINQLFLTKEKSS